MKIFILILAGVISSTNAFASFATQSEVFKFCARQDLNSDKAACIQLAQGSLFDRDALDVCADMRYDSNMRSCLQSIANDRFTPVTADFCIQLISDADKRSCMKAVANKDYSMDSVRFCSLHRYDSDKLSCIRAIASRPLEKYSPIQNPPTVKGDVSVSGKLCLIKETQKWVPGNSFFSEVSEFSQKNRTCAIARIAGKESGRIYQNGERVAKDRGALSQNEINQVLSSHRLSNCQRFTCEEK